MYDLSDDIKANKDAYKRKLDHFIADLLLARRHFDCGLTDKDLGNEVTEKLHSFLTSMEKSLPQNTQKRIQRLQDFDETDPAGNPKIDKKAKRLVYSTYRKNFFTVIENILPAVSPLPRIVATIPEAPEENYINISSGIPTENNTIPATPASTSKTLAKGFPSSPPGTNGQSSSSTSVLSSSKYLPPLVVSLGEVVKVSTDDGPNYILVTDLVDPSSFEATFAVAYGVRLWTIDDILSLGFPAAESFESKMASKVTTSLGGDENWPQLRVALSNFKDVVRPGTILGRVRWVPPFWADPTAAPDVELLVDNYFDFRTLSVSSLNFHLDTEPWKVLEYLRSRQLGFNDLLRRDLDYFVDRLYHAALEHFISFQASVTQDNKLVPLTVVVEREWLLRLPDSVIRTAKWQEDTREGPQTGDNCSTLAFWVQTRDEAEEVLGPSDHNDASALRGTIPENYYVIKPRTGEAHIDRITFCIVLPMVLYFQPINKAATDVLNLKCHMVALSGPLDGSKRSFVHWDTRKVAVDEEIRVGEMPVELLIRKENNSGQRAAADEDDVVMVEN